MIFIHAFNQRRLADLAVFGGDDRDQTAADSHLFLGDARESIPEAGPAVIISFIVAAICAGLSALCYAELASAIPVSGSTYMCVLSGSSKAICQTGSALRYSIGGFSSSSRAVAILPLPA